MTTYTIKYRKVGSLFWNKIKKAKGDSLVYDNGVFLNRRMFICEDETVIEIDLHGMEVSFGKERHLSILERMSKEAGQNIQVDKR